MYDTVIFRNKKDIELGKAVQGVGAGLILLGVGYLFIGEVLKNSRHSIKIQALNDEAVDDISSILDHMLMKGK